MKGRSTKTVPPSWLPAKSNEALTVWVLFSEPGATAPINLATNHEVGLDMKPPSQPTAMARDAASLSTLPMSIANTQDLLPC